ncbi:MAG TPA: PqqD family protein [Thermoanaerobaculia bacterium]|jgi:hypothetical protein
MLPRRKAHLRARELPDGATMVMAPDGSMALLLNPMGSVVWRLCDGRRGAAEIAGFIVRELPDAAAQRVLSDVESLLGELRVAGLIDDAAGESQPCGSIDSEL